MFDHLGSVGDDSEDILSEFIDDEDREQFKLLCFCEICGFRETLLYQEGEKDIVKDIAKSIHEQKSPNCNGKVSC
jgi:hypothetical protein